MNNPNWQNPNWSPTWNSPTQFSYGAGYSPAQPNTNKIYVTSLEDALNRAASRGSEMVYFHQDNNEFYVVKTDMDGRKSWAGFTYNIPNQDASIPATKADFKELVSRIEALEKKGQVTDDVQPNG